jgi:hypothetical protein
MHSGCNQACLAIFKSVAGNGGPDDAAGMEARRLGISPKRARSDIVAVAAGLYRAGLLHPAGRSER